MRQYDVEYFYDDGVFDADDNDLISSDHPGYRIRYNAPHEESETRHLFCIASRTFVSRKHVFPCCSPWKRAR